MEEKNTKLMPPEKAKKMVELYRANGGKHPQGELTKSVWFSVEKLQGMLDEIANTPDIKHPGIRFYFGTYTEKEEFTTINGDARDYKFRNTLIMVSTKQVVENGRIINEDFNVTKFLDPENQGELCPEECGGGDRWE